MNYGKEIFLIEMEGKDPSELGFQNITKLLQHARPFTFQNLVHKKILYQ